MLSPLIWPPASARMLTHGGSSRETERDRVFFSLAHGHSGESRPCWIALFLCLVFTVQSANALNPERRISQYGHTAWRIQDGVFEGAPHAMAQTTDGYLWIGTEAGLVRFDGVRFVPWTAPSGKSLPSSEIHALLGARDGGLWIGTSAGLAYWKDQTIVTYPDTDGRINSIVEDRQGAVWIARSRPRNARGPVCRIDGKAVQCYGVAEGISFPWAQALADDRAGGVWIGTTQGVCHWTPGGVRNYFPDNLKHANGSAGVEALGLAPDGSLLVGIGRAGPGLGMRTLVQGTWKEYGPSLSVEAMLIDRERGVWIATADSGIAHGEGSTDRFQQSDGLSSDSIGSFFEDREGNVWTTSPRGIDRFRDLSISTFSKREGLRADAVASVFAARDGTVWLGSGDALVSLRSHKLERLATGGKQVTSVLEDHAGRIWMGVDSGLVVRETGALRKVRKADGSPLGMVTGLIEDGDRNIWALAIGKPQKLIRIQDGRVKDEVAMPYPAIGGALAADPKDGIWLGFTNGKLARFRSGKFEILPGHDDGAGAIRHVLVDPDGPVWAASQKGLVHWKEGTRRTLGRANGLACDSLFSAIRDNAGVLWLYASCGVIAIAPSDLERWWERPDTAVASRVFDVFDGAQPGATPFSPPVTKSADGRLWFTNDTALQYVNPERLTGNRVPPPVRIENIVADQATYSPVANLRFPSSMRNLEIDYTALSFTAPQKVRFRYKLEPRDESWSQPVARRQAFYNSLAPGRYRFRVVACNDSGIWNDAEASWGFVIEPAYYQTMWFRFLFLAGCGFGLWGMYELRVQRIAARLNARFDERMAERNRLSSELHDTFLQSVEASKMVADHALVEEPRDPDRMRRAMETLSGWLAQATADGRAALNTLRSSASLRNNLAEAFQRAAEVARAAGSMEFVLSVEGTARAIHPIVRDEVVRIGSEAIRNLCLYSGRGVLEVKIRYAHDLRIWVRDNIENIVPGGKGVRSELTAMAGRAKRIGGELYVRNTRNSGTEIELRVPGRIAFGDGGRWNFLAKLRGLWRNK